MRTILRLPLDICLEDIMPVITVEQDDTPVRGNAIDTGDADEDRREEDGIISRLNDGDVWAWCVVTVSVSALGFTGSDTLGACRYDNEHDFRTDANYQSMVAAANTDLMQKLVDAGFVAVKA